MKRRVVITGVGLVTPLGTGVEGNWQALIAGRSGIGHIQRFDASRLPCSIAGEVCDFHAEDFFDPHELRRTDLFIQYAVAAALMAMADAGLTITAELAPHTGVIVGVGLGGLPQIEANHLALLEGGVRRVSPFFIPAVIGNLAPGQIALRLGVRGVNFAIATACASGAHALGEAFELVRSGRQEVAIAGGAEAIISPLSLAGFAAMHALATRYETPEKASRPFDRERNGFVLAEGAGIVVLETLERARSRGGRIYGEIIGYGATADAHHITQPQPDGEGAARALALALGDAAISPEAVGYINAHGTSTKWGDLAETRAIKAVFGRHAYRLAVSSTKSMTGHLLGAAGAVGAIYTLLVLQCGILPPTVNYENPDPECDLDYVPNRARPAHPEVALTNSFGFGGVNAVLALRRWE